VSRRWRQLAHSPALLAAMSVEILFNPPSQPPLLSLRSFATWLARHAANHVVRLRLTLMEARWLAEAVNVQAAAVISAAIAHCCAAGKLETLQLDLTKIDYQPLFIHCPSLRRLGIWTDEGTLSVTVPLDGLSQLQWLELDGRATVVGSAAQLPKTLTRLLLGDNGDLILPTFPMQVGFMLILEQCS
jgi:hypothetical protein